MNKCIPKIIIILYFGLMINPGIAQNFTWMKGPNQPNDPGSYGTMGVPSNGDYPPARLLGQTWTDNNNNLWLFGGLSCAGPESLNDLWKYDISTNQWVWMKGANNCGAIGLTGVYGTQGVPSINNSPGGRNAGVTWKDAAGDLWLYGGYGLGATTTLGTLSDLWKYNVATNMWTWVAGSANINEPPHFGTKGLPSALNTPGGLASATGWADPAGNFWLYGGTYGGTANNTSGVLWKLTMSTKQWTWVHGDTLLAKPPVYGTQAAAANWPGARTDAISWTDNAGKFWLFGGIGVASSAPLSIGNDLWKFDPAISQWVWVSGKTLTNNSNYSSQYPEYCAQGISSSLSMPGARYRSTSFKDAAGDLWLWGGFGYAGAVSQSSLVSMNDLWRYSIAFNSWTWMKGTIALFPSPIFGTKGVAAPSNIPGGKEGSMGWMDLNNHIWLLGGSGSYGGNNYGFGADLWKYDVPCTVPVITTSIPACTLCPGQSQTLTAGGAANYTWSTGANTNSVVLAPSATTGYTLTSTGSGTCASEMTFTLTVKPGNCVGLADAGNAIMNVRIFPNPSNGSFIVAVDQNDEAIMKVHSNTGQLVLTAPLARGENVIGNNLPAGIYFVSVSSNTQPAVVRKLLVEK
jgi:N-acetylneuraminic acid mutarotase